MLSLFGRKRSQASLALRLALASALFGLIVACGAIIAGYWALSQQLDVRAAAEMQGRRELLLHILKDVPSQQVVADPGHRFADLFYGHDDLHLALVEARSGQLVASIPHSATETFGALRGAAVAPGEYYTWVTAKGERFSGINGTAALADGEQLLFYLTVDRQPDAMLLGDFVKATLVAVPSLMLLVAIGAGLIARTGLAPLRRFNQLAASIGTKSLDQRISLAGLPGEMADMAVEFNKMLERIHDGYRRLQDFSGDLAHELRTPLATLLGRTQVALSQTRSVADLRDVLEGNVEELERLSRLTSDMLFIASAEHDSASIQIEAVDLAREARRVADFLALIAEEKGVQLQVSGTAPSIPADHLLIQRAITNLASNAIRHAIAGSAVVMEVASNGHAATVKVTNHGEGIAPADQERIFDRFYRVDSGRARLKGGTGLGLAIVKSIAAAHEGNVSVLSAFGQTSFTLTFPVAKVSDRK
jgi:two-component system heavy metal sensor histidine kinase CusS